MDADTTSCLGKVPSHGEFVRYRASTPTMRAFDKWLRRGLHYARQNECVEWEAAYDQAPTIRFLLWGHCAQAPKPLLGVLRPSRDNAGRTYPFVVTCEIPVEGLTIRHLPHVLVHASSFYGTAEGLVSRATEGDIPYQKIPDVVKGMNPEVAVGPTLPRSHKRYLQRETLGTLSETLFGHFDHSEKYRLFSNLFEILQPFQGVARVQLDYGLQFPLQATADHQLNVASFWVDLVLRILEYPSIHPSLFWTEPEGGGDSARLNLFLGKPEPSALSGILAPSRADGSFYSLRSEGGGSTADAALSIPESSGELLENEQIRLWDFLRRV